MCVCLGNLCVRACAVTSANTFRVQKGGANATHIAHQRHKPAAMHTQAAAGGLGGAVRSIVVEAGGAVGFGSVRAFEHSAMYKRFDEMRSYIGVCAATVPHARVPTHTDTHAHTHTHQAKPSAATLLFASVHVKGWPSAWLRMGVHWTHSPSNSLPLWVSGPKKPLSHTHTLGSASLFELGTCEQSTAAWW